MQDWAKRGLDYIVMETSGAVETQQSAPEDCAGANVWHHWQSSQECHLTKVAQSPLAVQASILHKHIIRQHDLDNENEFGWVSNRKVSMCPKISLMQTKHL